MRSPFQLLETGLQEIYRVHRRIILHRQGLGGRPWADTEMVCGGRGIVQSGSNALRKRDAGRYFSVPDLGMTRWD